MGTRYVLFVAGTNILNLILINLKLHTIKLTWQHFYIHPTIQKPPLTSTRQARFNSVISVLESLLQLTTRKRAIIPKCRHQKYFPSCRTSCQCPRVAFYVMLPLTRFGSAYVMLSYSFQAWANDSHQMTRCYDFSPNKKSKNLSTPHFFSVCGNYGPLQHMIETGTLLDTIKIYLYFVQKRKRG
jgi:hypothetical protein